MSIEHTIQRLTNDGEIIVQFLVDNIQGNNDATMNHRMKSTEWLAALGGFIPESEIPKSASIRPRPKSEPKPKKAKRDKAAKPDKPDKPDKPANKPPVTEKEILHFDLARQIKRDTRDAETIIQFLLRVILKAEEPGENFTPAVRMRAARELLIRGFGSTTPGLRRILSGKTEELDSYLAKLLRENCNYGADFVLFLIEVMENNEPDEDDARVSGPKHLRKRAGKPIRKPKKPYEGFKASHRVWAACELLRRAYDIRTDHITYEDINAYWTAQTDADPDVDDAPILKRLGRSRERIDADEADRRAIAAHNAELERQGVQLGFTREEIDAQAAQLRALAAAQTRATDHADRAHSAADITTENPTYNAVSAENPAYTNGATNHVDAAHSAADVTTEPPGYRNGATRADRRRQQRAAAKTAAVSATGENRATRRAALRAARKAEKCATHSLQKPAPQRPNRPGSGRLTPEDRAEIEAFKERLRARALALRQPNIPDDP